MNKIQCLHWLTSLLGISSGITNCSCSPMNKIIQHVSEKKSDTVVLAFPTIFFYCDISVVVLDQVLIPSPFPSLPGVVSGAMLLIEDDPRINPDTLWTELIVSATVSSVQIGK